MRREIYPIYPEYHIWESDDLYLHEGMINGKWQWTMESWILLKHSDHFFLLFTQIVNQIFNNSDYHRHQVTLHFLSHGLRLCVSLCLLRNVFWYVLT